MLGAELRRLGGDTTRLGDIPRLLIVLDGLDEQAERFSEDETSRLLFQVSGTMPATSKIMLTCRTHFFRDRVAESRLLTARDRFATGLLRHDRPIPKLYLAPLSLDQREDYLRRTQGADWERAARTIDHIYDLQDLANRPILLNLITHLLPELRAEQGGIGQARLYEIAARSWLDRERWRGLEPAEVLRFVEELAFTSLINDTPFLHHRDLSESVRQHFDARILSAVDLEAWDGVVRTSLFLNRDADGNYTFMHKSFQEYFAARALVASVGRPFRDLPDQASHSITPETVVFVGQMMSPASYRRLFDMLADETSTEAAAVAAQIVNHLKPPADLLPDDEEIDRIGPAYHASPYVHHAEAVHYVFRTTRSRRSLPMLFAELYEHPNYNTSPAVLATIAAIADERDVVDLTRLRRRMTTDMRSVLDMDVAQFESILWKNGVTDHRTAELGRTFEKTQAIYRAGGGTEIRLSNLLVNHDKSWTITIAEVNEIIDRVRDARPGDDGAHRRP
jgi:hypothetical protein